MAVISTTGQGQGAAQVVKQRPSQMGTIVSSFVDDYLAEQAAKAKAQQEANAIEYEVSMAKDGLTGAYLGKANALEEDITSRVKRGEISSKEGGRLLIDYSKRIRGDQDKIFSDLKNASKINSENYTHDEFGNVVDAPASEIGKLLLGPDSEKRGYENFDELNSKVTALYSRQAPRPKQDIPTIIKNKYIPLIEKKYNIKIDETLSPEQQDLMLKSKISSLPQEAKNEIIAMFLEDEDVRTNIYLKNSEAQMNTPEGAGFNDEFIDEKAKSFIEPFLGNRQVLESDIQKTGDGSGKGLVEGQDFEIVKKPFDANVNRAMGAADVEQKERDVLVLLNPIKITQEGEREFDVEENGKTVKEKRKTAEDIEILSIYKVKDGYMAEISKPSGNTGIGIREEVELTKGDIAKLKGKGLDIDSALGRKSTRQTLNDREAERRGNNTQENNNLPKGAEEVSEEDFFTE